MRERIVIIGGGGTGAAAAYELALRGYQPILLERGELTSGTTGRHHGQLHCGARYAMGDRNIAAECMAESAILRKIAPQAIEFNYGMFVSVTDDDASYTEQFIEDCRASGIPAEEISVQRARELEPTLSEDIRSAVLVPDGTIDPWRLSLHFFAGAGKEGAELKPFHELTEIDIRAGKLRGLTARDRLSGKDRYFEADVIVNAAGPWAGQIAEKAGAELPVSPSPGTMVAVKGRLTSMVISRLHPAGDGDIIVPQRKLSIIGSTQWLAEDPDHIQVPSSDTKELLAYADMMIPSFSAQPFHAAWSASRPLFGAAGEAAVRELSRDFSVIDHSRTDDAVYGFFSVTGGKATTLRGMGEAVAEAVCSYLGSQETEQVQQADSSQLVLPGHRAFYLGGDRG